MKHPRFLRLAAVATGALVAVTLTACSSSTSGKASADSPSKVLYLLPTLDDEAYTREAAGAKAEAAAHKDISLEVTASTDRKDPTALLNKIDQAITQQYSTIIVDPGGFGDQLAPALNRAIAAHIKVILMLAGAPAIEGVKATTTITWDSQPSYKAAGQYMGKLLPDGGEIGVIACAIGNSSMDLRRSGFAAGLPSNIKEVAIGDAACDPAKARAITENMLTAHPDLKGIFSDTDLALNGVIPVLQADHKDLAVIGGDGQTANLKFIADGEIQDATTRYPSETFGAMTIRVAEQLAEGKKVAKTIAAPTYPLVTKDNAAEVLKSIQAIAAGKQKPALPGD